MKKKKEVIEIAPDITEDAPLDIAEEKLRLSELGDSIGQEIGKTEDALNKASVRLLTLERDAFMYANTSAKVETITEAAEKIEQALKYLNSANRFLKQITE